MSLSVTVRRSESGRVAVVTLVGEHDIATSRLVRRALLDTRGTAVTVLDLGQCTFVDSTILVVFVGAHIGWFTAAQSDEWRAFAAWFRRLPLT